VNKLGRGAIKAVKALKAILPSLKEGRRADQTNATLPYEIGAAGRSDSVPLKDSDLPGYAVAKVARHLISTAQPPLLQGGENSLNNASF
jgi:hypothetical protein